MPWRDHHRALARLDFLTLPPRQKRSRTLRESRETFVSTPFLWHILIRHLNPLFLLPGANRPFSVFFSFIFKLIFVSNSFQNYMTCGVNLRFAGNFNVKFANKFKTFQTLWTPPSKLPNRTMQITTTTTPLSSSAQKSDNVVPGSIPPGVCPEGLLCVSRDDSLHVNHFFPPNLH